MYYSLYNWIGEHEITKLKEMFASDPEKKDTKASTKRPFDIFSNAHA